MNHLLFYGKENQIPPTYSSLNFYIFLSLQFSNVKIFHLSFLRDWEAHKVETWYTHGQRIDLLCTSKTSSQNILVPLFFFFFLSLQLAKIYKLFQHTSDGYSWGYVSCAHSLLYSISTWIPWFRWFKMASSALKIISHSCVSKYLCKKMLFHALLTFPWIRGSCLNRRTQAEYYVQIYS